MASAGRGAAARTGAGVGRGVAAGAGRLAGDGAGALLPLTRNSATTWVSFMACSRRLSAAAVDCSTKAEFCCVIWSSWFMAVLTWAMPWLCSDVAERISPMMSVTR